MPAETGPGWRLVERDGEHAGRAVSLPAGGLVIGRGEDCEVVVALEAISRRHARITLGPDGPLLADLSSKNGTRLNGVAITGPRLLHHGDRIDLPGRRFVVQEIGRTVTWTPPGLPWLLIDSERLDVQVDGRAVPVTAKEYAALCLLAERPGRLVGREELACRVWPEQDGIVTNDAIERLIGRVRAKVAGDGASQRLVAVRGLGYRLLPG